MFFLILGLVVLCTILHSRMFSYIIKQFMDSWLGCRVQESPMPSSVTSR